MTGRSRRKASELALDKPADEPRDRDGGEQA